MEWIGNVTRGTGSNGMFPTRTYNSDGIADWVDPVIPTEQECQAACGESGFFDGDSPEKSKNWDGLMLYLGKLRDDGSQAFWRRILTADDIFMAWLGDPEVQNSLSKLLYEQINGPITPGWDVGQALTQAEIDHASGDTKNTGLVFLKRIFEKVAQGDSFFIKKLIYRTLSSVSNTEQCEKSEKQWNGNETKCWLCNQNITNIYLGGAGMLRKTDTITVAPPPWQSLYNNPNGFNSKKENLTVGETAKKAQDTPDSGTNPYLSSHSIHNKECEHVLPYIVGTFILQIYRGKPDKNITQEQREKIKRWLNFEYEWSHSYCNQVKSQGHFLQYNEETGNFEIDYVQIANFSKRLRCQGNYNGKYSKEQKECNATTGGNTLREENWRTFTDESGDGRWRDATKQKPQKKFIITSCDPAATTAEESSCRKSFYTESKFDLGDPTNPNSINSPESEANKYLASKGAPPHTWRKDSDLIIEKMQEIVDLLNTPIPAEVGSDGKPVPPADALPTASTYGTTALLRARISSFLITKYLEDVGKKLQSSKGNKIWGISLPSAWDLKKDGVKFDTTGKDTKNIAEKFVIGLAYCCEAALKTAEVGLIDPATGKNQWSKDWVTAQSWIDGCINGANAAYAAITSIADIKGESGFGVQTRAQGNLLLLMSRPDFVIKLLSKINDQFPDLISNIISEYSSSINMAATAIREGTLAQNTTLPDIINRLLSLPTPFKRQIDSYSSRLESVLSGVWIERNLAAAAEAIIPGITSARERTVGSSFNSRWTSVSRYIINHFHTFIINLYFYNSPISTNFFSEEIIQKLDTLYADNSWEPDFLENPEMIDVAAWDAATATDLVAAFSEAPDKTAWLGSPEIIQLMSSTYFSIVNGFWNIIFKSVRGFIQAVINPNVQTLDAAILYISNYLKQIVKNQQILEDFLTKVVTDLVAAFSEAPDKTVWLERPHILQIMSGANLLVVNGFWNIIFKSVREFIQAVINPNVQTLDAAILYISNYLIQIVKNQQILEDFLTKVVTDLVAAFIEAPDKTVWLERPHILQIMSGTNLLIVNGFWNIIIQNVEQWIQAVINPKVQTLDAAILYISNYLNQIVKNQQILKYFLAEVDIKLKPQVRPASRRLQGLEAEFEGLFGKINYKFGTKPKRKAKSKPKRKAKSKPKRKAKSKPKRKAKSKPKNSFDKILKNKLKMVGIKVTKKVKGKRVKLTKRELQKKLLAFKKLQTKAKKLKIQLKYKSTNGRYKFKTQKRLISDINKVKLNKRNN